MTESVLTVDGMSCDHCVKAVNDALSALPGVETVDVSLVTKKVAVHYDSAQTSLDDIKNAIENQGFDVAA